MSKAGSLDMVPKIIEVICAAIENKRCLAVRYKNQSQIRVIEPHFLYRTSRGRFVVESYQTRGYSSGGRIPPFWRPFQVRKISTIQVLDELFNPRLEEGFKTVRRLVNGEVIAEIDPTPSDYNYFNSGVYGPPPPQDDWSDVSRRLRSYG